MLAIVIRKRKTGPREAKKREMRNRADSPNTHDLSIQKRTVERADEVSYLLIQVKKHHR